MFGIMCEATVPDPPGQLPSVHAPVPDRPADYPLSDGINDLRGRVDAQHLRDVDVIQPAEDREIGMSSVPGNVKSRSMYLQLRYSAPSPFLTASLVRKGVPGRDNGPGPERCVTRVGMLYCMTGVPQGL